MPHLIPNATGIQNPLITKRPKPVFVMRFRNSMSDSDFKNVKDTLWQSDIAKEYHIVAIRNDKDKDEFEMYNADKIDKQEWNDLINLILKK